MKHNWIGHWLAGEWAGWRCSICKAWNKWPPGWKPGVQGCPGPPEMVRALEELKGPPKASPEKPANG